MAEPIYVVREDDFSGPHGSSRDPRFALRPDFIEKVKGVPAARGRWLCPHCDMEFLRRKPCDRHIGNVANIPTSCEVLIAQDAVRRTHGQSQVVILTWPEVHEANGIAEKRNRNALEEFRRAVNGIAQNVPEAILANICGARGEKAYSKVQQLPWTRAFLTGDLRRGQAVKPPDFGNTDIKGACVETLFDRSKHLLLQEHDPPDRYYILALCKITSLVVEFAGWGYGKDLLRGKSISDPFNTGRPCYWIPQSELQPMSTWHHH